MRGEGGWELKGMTEEGDEVTMEVQIADVKRVLGSVRKICQAGNRVVFEEGKSYIQNKRNGRKTPISEGRNGYTVNLWVPKGKVKVSSAHGYSLTGNFL